MKKTMIHALVILIALAAIQGLLPGARADAAAWYTCTISAVGGEPPEDDDYPTGIIAIMLTSNTGEFTNRWFALHNNKTLHAAALMALANNLQVSVYLWDTYEYAYIGGLTVGPTAPPLW